MSDREKLVFWRTFGICSFISAMVLCFFLYKAINKEIDVNLVQYPVFQEEEKP